MLYGPLNNGPFRRGCSQLSQTGVSVVIALSPLLRLWVNATPATAAPVASGAIVGGLAAQIDAVPVVPLCEYDLSFGVANLRVASAE